MHSELAGRRLVYLGVAVAIALAALLTFNMRLGSIETLPSASAHQWGCLHWHRGGSTVYIGTYNTAFNRTAANNAIADIHYRNHPLYLWVSSYSTDIAVFDGFYGSTPWSALGTVSYSGCHILSGQAKVNRSYSGTQQYYQGLFCQEIGHTLGLDHSNTGDCMGLSYFSFDKYYFGSTSSYGSYSHPSADLYNMYRYHS